MVDSWEATYDNIKAARPVQHENYQSFVSCLSASYKGHLVKKLNESGFHMNISSGRLSYSPSFVPLPLSYTVCYIRHGKTAGNTEPRVYQGQVDYENNQLNEIGRKQAKDAADMLECELSRRNTRVALVAMSPLKRAKETGEAFTTKHPEIPVEVVEGFREMAFGFWDNMMVKDLNKESIGHLFYLEQNALVKTAEPHMSPEGPIASENFVEVVLRQRDALLELCQHPAVEAQRLGEETEGEKSGPKKPLVVIYGHSMAGAAVSILLGHGMSDEDGLGFDGRYIMPNATPTFLPAQRPGVKGNK